MPSCLDGEEGFVTPPRQAQAGLGWQFYQADPASPSYAMRMDDIALSTRRIGGCGTRLRPLSAMAWRRRSATARFAVQGNRPCTAWAWSLCARGAPLCPDLLATAVTASVDEEVVTPLVGACPQQPQPTPALRVELRPCSLPQSGA